MCGIFGIANYSERKLSVWRKNDLVKLSTNLLSESEIRGTDASGICILSDDSVGVFKDRVKGSEIKNFSPFKSLLERISEKNEFKSLIGHTRSQTKGPPMFNENNHPIIANKTIGVHNGIISNDEELFLKYKTQIDREGTVDSEIIFRLIDMYIANGNTIVDAVKKTSKELSGSYACAFLHLDWPNYITIFKGGAYPSVYIYTYDIEKIIVFASADSIIDRSIENLEVLDKKSVKSEFELGTNEGVRINVHTGKMFKFEVKPNDSCYGGGHGSCILCKRNDCESCPHFIS